MSTNRATSIFPERLIYILSCCMVTVGFFGVLFFILEEISIENLLVWAVLPITIYLIFAFLATRHIPYAFTITMIGFSGLAFRLLTGIYMYSQVIERGQFPLFIKDDRYFFDQAIYVLSSPDLLRGIERAIQTNSTQIGPILFNMIPIALFGADPRNVVAFASIVGAITVILMYQFAIYFVPPRWSLLSAFIIAFFPQNVYLAAALQRDLFLVLGFILAGIVLMRIQENTVQQQRTSLFHLFLLFFAILITMVWRFAYGVVLLVVMLAFFFYGVPRLRLSSVIPAVVGVFILLPIGTYFVRPDVFESMLDQPFEMFDPIRYDKLAQADTFGFLQGATGSGRFLMLPITLIVAVIMGFGPYQGIPNNDFVQIGYIWFWMPFIIPMLLGANYVWRHQRRRWFLLWVLPLSILLIYALTYQGMMPRYRSAVDPYMILLGIIGLRLLGPRLKLFWFVMIAGSVISLWLLWLGAVPDPLSLVVLSFILSFVLYELIVLVAREDPKQSKVVR